MAGPAPRGPTRIDEIDEAITQATVDLLVENGFSGPSIERIAARAQTGKTSIYRRGSRRPSWWWTTPSRP